jgi:hypothetical protein
MKPTHHLPIRAAAIAAALVQLAIGSFAQSPTPARDSAVAGTSVFSATEPRTAGLDNVGLKAAPVSGNPFPAAFESKGSGLPAAERDADLAAKSIVHLPEYVVQSPRLPVFRERGILTRRGLGELAESRYIAPLDRLLNAHPLPVIGASLRSRALAMYAEDEQRQSLAGLANAVRAAALIDPAAGADLKRLAEATYLRHNDLGTGSRPN